jgi:DNA-binding Lrp family transcriptional regulator
MLTPDSRPVDAPDVAVLPLAPAAVMFTVSEIAERDGISKQAVSKRVKALVDDHGLAVETDARGNVARVNVVHYDLLRERHGNPSKDQRPAPSTESSAPAGDSYEEALRLKTHYEATRKGIELDEQMGKLVRVDELQQAVADVGAEIAAIVGKVEQEADALAAAGMRDGPHGIRVALKQVKFRMLTEIADALDALGKRNAQASEASAGN